MCRMDEKVSICIPAYNNANIIGTTIDAILEQSYRNFELIIVDDASTDNTVQVIKGYHDSRIKLYNNEKNMGMAGNWNRCVRLASSKYIKLVCADDIIKPKCIETELEAMLSHKDVVMTINDSIMVNLQKKKLGVFRRYPKKGIIDGNKLARNSLIVSNFFGMPCAVMFRKDVFDWVGGFDKHFKYILDFDLWLSMALYGKVLILPQKLNYFTLREDSNTGKVLSVGHKAYYDEHVMLLEKHAKRLKLNKFHICCSKLSRKLRSVVYGMWLRYVLMK